MQVFIVFVCLQVESACGVFVSRSERPAPVINGVPVWGTARRRTQSLGQTAAPPGLSFTWGEEKGGKEGRVEGQIFPRCPLLSLSSPLPIHPAFSLLKLSTFTTAPTLFSLSVSLRPLPFRWPLSSVQLKLWHVHMYSHTCTNVRNHFFKNTQEKKKAEVQWEKKDKVNCQHNTSSALKKKAGVEVEEPAVKPSPHHPTSPSLQFGYAAPLLSVKQAF